MRKSNRRLFLPRIICTILIVFTMLGQVSLAATYQDETDLLYLKGILEMIRDQYKGDIPDDELVYNATKGMLESLDPYTVFYNNEETEDFVDTISGTFGGIGVSMQISGDYIVIMQVFSDSPAKRAGLLQGDKIVEADGISLVKESTDKAASLIKGEVGTKVKLGILRDGRTVPKYFEVTREIINVNPVAYEIRGEIGYIKLDMFSSNSDEYIAKALSEMDRNKIKKIILDLRNNPGGEVNQAVEIAGKFVPKGLITKLDYQSSRYRDISYYSYLENPKYNLAVLVNSNSASASEIVAGAIQDTGAGKLVGMKTYGKAKFQSLIPLLTLEAFEKYKAQGILAVNGYDLQAHGIYPTGDEIVGYTKMSLGVYYTPNGRMIDGTGLEPDFAVDDPQPVSDIYVNDIGSLTGEANIRLNGQGVDVFNSEMILKIMGYKVQTPDNTLGTDTAAALKAYQKDTGLSVTAILDKQTRTALNADLIKLILQYDMQYSKAVDLLN